MSSIQVASASAAITVNGTVTGYVTVASVTPFVAGAKGTLSQAGARAAATVTFNGAVAADNVAIAGVTFVGTAGAVVPGQATYSIDTSNDAAAVSLAAQVLAHATTSLLVTAVATPAVCTFTALAVGLGGNAIVLTSTSAPHLAVTGGGHLIGGLDGGTVRQIQIADIGGGGANTLGIRFLADPPDFGQRLWDMAPVGPTYGRSDCASIVSAANWTITQAEQIVFVPRTTL